jgi:hypothetical protein
VRRLAAVAATEQQARELVAEEARRVAAAAEQAARERDAEETRRLAAAAAGEQQAPEREAEETAAGEAPSEIKVPPRRSGGGLPIYQWVHAVPPASAETGGSEWLQALLQSKERASGRQARERQD